MGVRPNGQAALRVQVTLDPAKPIRAQELDPLFRSPDRSDVESAWYGPVRLAHWPFAHWIIRASAFRRVVEPGSRIGVGYVAPREAVRREGLGIAVDAWTGDEHAGFHDQEVSAGIRAGHDGRFVAFSTLIRRAFDDAPKCVATGPVESPPVDGGHGDQDVEHDFEAWDGTMSTHGGALLHDTHVYGNGFGVWRLGSEPQRDVPCFAFGHAHGPGGVAIGSACPPVIAARPDRVGAARLDGTRLGAA